MSPLNTEQARRRVLVTGSRGLIGSVVASALRDAGYTVVTFDVRDRERQDVTRYGELLDRVTGCSGVVHLAAVSRVALGEQYPERCKCVNVGGLQNLLAAITNVSPRPWLLFTSSREVYGAPGGLPVAEDAPLKPLNVYGRTKLEGEQLVSSAVQHGLRAAVVRLTNVYGSTNDHDNRVVPAFIRAALTGSPLRVDGRGHTFDFTYVRDVARGLLRVVAVLEHGGQLPVLQLASGLGTTLAQLADHILTLTGSRSAVVEGYPRNFDVDRFVGDPTLATKLLGWKHTTSLVDGLSYLIEQYREKLDPVATERRPS